MFDITIIGAGIVGTSTARELSKYDLKILLLDKEIDVANGTTKANSAIVHAGYDAVPGTLKAKLNASGNKMFDRMCRELSVPFKRIGSLVIAFSDEDMAVVRKLYDRGILNGIPEMEIIGKKKLKEIEPNINDDAVGALWAKTAGIVSPYELCIAQAENAVQNGVKLKLETEVSAIERWEGKFIIKTNRGDIETKYIVNCAGLFSDSINKMLGGEKFEIVPRKGEYCLFDKSQGGLVNHTIFQVPTRMGKGILVTPTVHGNLLIGPDAVDIGDKEDISTTEPGLETVINGARKSIEKFSMRDVITSFAGLRATVHGGDFIINSPADHAVNAAGIDSPGLSSSPAIAVMIASMLEEMGITLNKKKDFNPVRSVHKRFAEMTNAEKNEAIKKNPLYGRVICRCETVTEGEIVDAIKRPVGARTVDGIKRRLRAGMGRCQGGFCMPRVVEILSRELNIPYNDVLKGSSRGYIVTGKLKENLMARDGEDND